jgi:hypothetical protein
VADSDPDLIARIFRFDERFYRLRRSGGRGAPPQGSFGAG